MINNKEAKRNLLVKNWEALQGIINATLKSIIVRIYLPFLNAVLNHRYAALSVFIAFFAMALALLPGGQVRTVFFPNIESGNVRAKLEMKIGVGSRTFSQAARQIELGALKTKQQLQALYPTQANAIRHSYSGSTGKRSAEFYIELSSDAERSFSIKDVIERWRKNTGHINGAKSFSIYAQGASEESSDIAIYISSANSAHLKPVSSILKSKLLNFKGVSNVKSSLDEGEIQLEIQLKQAAHTLGLSHADIARQIRYAFYGYEVQRYQRGSEELKVWVRYPKGKRDQYSDLKKIFIETSNGNFVQLDTVANLVPSQSPSQIDRFDHKRTVSVSAKSDKEQVSASELIDQLQTEIFVKLGQQYPSISLQIGAEAAEESLAMQSLLTGFLVALAMIYVLLAIPLKSYTQPVVIMFAIPFAIIGAVLGHLFIGIPMSILSFFGLLALSGVVVNDALVLTSRFNDLRGVGLGFYEAINEAGRSRFRAILLTSITTFVGLLPLMFENAEQAQFLIPMAVSLGFGILFATFINLLLIPVLLAVIDDIKRVLLGESFSVRNAEIKRSDI
jgi:multidrug efflux pump subunit AcrB